MNKISLYQYLFLFLYIKCIFQISFYNILKKILSNIKK